MKKIICTIQILLLASPLTFFSSYAGACEATCQKMDLESEKLASCTDATPPVGATCAEQKTLFESRWGQTAPHCDAIDAFDDAEKADGETALVYTAAAIVCGIACYAGTASFGTAVAACTVSGLGAGIYDIAQASKMGDSVPATGVIAAAGSAALIATQIANILGTTLTLNGSKYTLNNQAAACVATGFSVIVAAIKYINKGKNGEESDKECSKVDALAGDGTGVTPPTQPGGAATAGSNNTSGTSNLTGSGSNGSGSGGTGTGGVDTSNFPTSVSAATAGGMNDKFFSQLPNRNLIPEALKDAGLSMADLKSKLDSGMSPSAIMAGMPGISTEDIGGLNALDETLKKYKVQFDGGNAFETSKGGGGGGAGAPASGAGGLGNWNLGGNAAPAQAGATALGFGAKTSLVSAESTDIWHSDFNGTIFQIVSFRLDKSRDKVDKTEWFSPLNRMIMGLPNTPAKKTLK